MKYNMPARMWKHGIHEFLEILKHQLPSSKEFMVQFVNHAFHVLYALLETVPAFKGIWLKYLGHLSRYKMVTEDDPRARKIWLSVECRYFQKACNALSNALRYMELQMSESGGLEGESLVSEYDEIDAEGESLMSEYDEIDAERESLMSEYDEIDAERESLMSEHDEIDDPEGENRSLSSCWSDSES